MINCEQKKRIFENKTMQNMHGVPLGHPASVASAGQPPSHTVAPPGGHGNPELSFEDFTSMSPFLDPAALHGLNPYASSLASSAAAASSGEFWKHFVPSNLKFIKQDYFVSSIFLTYCRHIINH